MRSAESDHWDTLLYNCVSYPVPFCPFDKVKHSCDHDTELSPQTSQDNLKTQTFTAEVLLREVRMNPFRQ